MLDWIIVAIGGGLLAAGCAVGSMATKLLQRLLISRRTQQASIKAASSEEAEANRETQDGADGISGGCSDGMEDLLFDEKLKLLVLKENLKKKLRQQKLLIQQLMNGKSAAVAVKNSPKKSAASVQVGAAGDLEAGSSAQESARRVIERQTKQEVEAEFFAAELELSNWQN